MTEHDDARLTAEVLAALRRDAFLEPLAMQVIVDNGVVTLTGSVDSEINRQTAVDIASRVPGVTSVIDQLTLVGKESHARADADLEREVREQIARDPTLEDPERFHVRAVFGKVIVSGNVESLEEQESVIAAIKRVPGVEEIDNRLFVEVPVISEERGQG